MTDDIDVQIEHARMELEQLHTRGKTESLNQKLVEEELRCRHQMKSKIEKLLWKETKRNLSDLHLYAQSLKKITPEKTYVPRVVIDLESLLCRSLHREGNLHHQVNLAERQSVDLIKQIRNNLCELNNETSASELHLLNKICILDNELTEYCKEVGNKSGCDESASESWALESIATMDDERTDHTELDYFITMLQRDTEGTEAISSSLHKGKGHRRSKTIDSYSTTETVSSYGSFQDLENDHFLQPLNQYEHANLLMV